MESIYKLDLEENLEVFCKKDKIVIIEILVDDWKLYKFGNLEDILFKIDI